MQKWREKASHVIHGTADMTDSSHNGLFTFLATAKEKPKN